MSTQSNINGEVIADCVSRFRERRPHIHCITNSVAQNFTANVLLAAGATPSMTINGDEVADFVDKSDGLLVNLGTMDAERSHAIRIAVDLAVRSGKPWALDPVFVQASSIRLREASALVNERPSLLRCNESEAGALFGEIFETTQLCSLARKYGTCIALTAAADSICDQNRVIKVHNGDALMDRVTAMGCALTAVIVGFLALEDDPLVCATAAVAFFGLAGEIARAGSAGPGSFVPVFLDALHSLSAEDITSGVRFS